MNDSEITELFFKRNEEAINELSVSYGRLLFSISQNILQNKEDSMECVNDTLFAVWSKIPPDRPKSLGAYCSAIARNTAIDRLRKRNALKRGADNIEAIFDELEYCIPDSARDFTEGVAIKEILNSFLEKQKPLLRQIFVLRYYFAYSIDEISHKTGKGQSYITVALTRMRGKLKEELQKGDLLK